MIQLRRPEGRFARVGHRGASALAPENTLRALELAVELGCDMLEFDVLDLADGTLVLAHSNDLREVSHGAARGRVRSRDLEGLRRVAPDLATLDEALAFCAERLPGIGLQLDLKRVGIEAATVEAVRRHGVLDRSWVSAFDARSLRHLAELERRLESLLDGRRGQFGGQPANLYSTDRDSKRNRLRRVCGRRGGRKHTGDRETGQDGEEKRNAFHAVNIVKILGSFVMIPSAPSRTSLSASLGSSTVQT